MILWNNFKDKKIITIFIYLNPFLSNILILEILGVDVNSGSSNLFLRRLLNLNIKHRNNRRNCWIDAANVDAHVVQWSFCPIAMKIADKAPPGAWIPSKSKENEPLSLILHVV